MADLRTEMVSLFADLQKIPEELGLRERTLELVTYTVVGANKARQKPGTRIANKVAVTPKPKATDAQNIGSPQYVKMKLGVIEEGDLYVSAIPRTYGEAQLRAAEEWHVDGVAYRLVRLSRKPLSWDAWLRRAKS